jgi:UDP-GlcNAc:undecaprenyl-phosphate/decaprenyl-phosphate GlcNAc-1-phosphate transferase
MPHIALLALVACVLTLLLTPAVRALSIAAGCVDRPDHRRKLHTGAIPRSGGVAILVSCLASYAITGRPPAMSSGLFTGMAIVFLTGLIDDIFDLEPLQKLAGEIAAAVWMWTAGVRIGVPGPLWWSLLVTVAWLVLCANAFNLVDGIDGLAAGLGLIAAAAMLCGSIMHGNVPLALATAPLAGCLLGFLRYNFSPASIFLGDSGSLSLGFLLASYAVIWGAKPATLFGIAAPAMALALPLLDAGLSIARRLIRNEPIFKGDRGHIHHRLLDRGIPPRRVALLLYAAGALGASLSLIPSTGGALIVAAAAVAGIRYLGYSEFRAARRFLSERLRPMLAAQVRVEVLERALLASATIDECWRAIEAGGKALGYSRVDASLAGLRFSTGGSRATEAWQVRIYLPGGDYVNVSQFAGVPAKPYVLAAFVDVIRRVVPEVLSSAAVEVLAAPEPEAACWRSA